MIRKLKGIIDTIDTNSVIIDVGGVGYHAFCSGHTLRQIPQQGEALTLHIETHVREDHIHLYGFASIDEKQAFNLLLKVNGVGSKMALSVLSVFSPSQLATAIAAQDKSAFKAVSGVGTKIAERIVAELKDKFSSSGSVDNFAMPSTSSHAQNNDINDAISALVNLGYSRSDAYSVINKISAQNDNMPVDALIRAGLKELSGKR
jgi:Holliday junction DNA helicase RuvA